MCTFVCFVLIKFARHCTLLIMHTYTVLCMHSSPTLLYMIVHKMPLCAAPEHFPFRSPLPLPLACRWHCC